MCGILGFISPKKPTVMGTKNLSAFMSQGMYVGGLRGRDSTGIMVVGRENYNVEIAKQAIEGASFVDTYNVENMLSGIADYSCGVIHHRAATKGLVISRNAHPFQVGDISLVHNGTIHNHKSLPGASNCAVDSLGIATALDQEDAVNVLEEIDGAFTLVWFDKSTNTFSISRNADRPLTIAYTKDDNILFASEGRMLEWLAVRNNIDITSVFEPEPLSLLQWKVDDKKEFSCRNYKSTKFEEKADPYARYYDNNYGNWGGGSNPLPANSEYQANKKAREKSLARYSIKVGDLIEFVGYEYIPYDTNKSQGVVKGVDVCMQFEVVCYGQPETLSDVGWRNSLCQARVLTVKDDPAYPWWITIVVGTPTINKENYYEKKSFEAVVESVVSPTPLPPDNEEAECDNETDKESRSSEYMVIGPQDVWIPRNEWSDLTCDGCCHCSTNLYTPDCVKWDSKGNAWCLNCWNSEQQSEEDIKQSMRGI